MAEAEAARAPAYRLLAGLVAADEEAIARARTTDPIAGWIQGTGDTELAAAHHQLFSQDAFPYGGVYLNPEALIGGEAADRVAAAAGELGLHPRRLADSADHLAVSLDLLGAARRDGARGLLATLVRWLPPWAAVAASGANAWCRIASLIVELVADDVAATAELPAAAPPPAPPFAADPARGLSALAADLCRPAIAGALLTRSRIQALGRRLDSPTGFGARRLMLANLLGAAGERGAGAQALAELSADFEALAEATERIGEATPPLAAWCHPWTERARSTAQTVREMAAVLRRDS